jgi:hypothetical protein
MSNNRRRAGHSVEASVGSKVSLDSKASTTSSEVKVALEEPVRTLSETFSRSSRNSSEGKEVVRREDPQGEHNSRPKDRI